LGAAIPGSVPGYRRVAAATGWALGVGACLAILVAAAGRPHEAYFDAQVQLGGARDILAAGAARTIERFSGAGERIAACTTRGRDGRP